MKMRTIVSALALLSSYALMGANTKAETTVPAPNSGQPMMKVDETPHGGNPLVDTLLGHPADSKMNSTSYDLLHIGKALDDSNTLSAAIDEDATDSPGGDHDVTVVPFPEGIWAALACLPMVLIGRWLFRRPT